MLVPKITTFASPDGSHRVICEQATPKKDHNGKEVLRVIFRSIDNEDSVYDYLYGKTYPSGSNELMRDLVRWIGLAVTRELLKKAPNVDWTALIGREAVIEAVHIKNSTHGNPYVHIQEIAPPDDPEEFEKAA